MQLAIFIVGTCSFLLLLFSLHLIFAEQGNKILNRLFAVVFLARLGQSMIFLSIASGNLTFFPLLQKLATPLYFAAPVCLYLYIRGFVIDRTRLRSIEWLHFIPVCLAIIHVIPWPFSPAINWDILAVKLLNGKRFVAERTGLFPAWFFYAGLPALIWFYLIATWRVVFSSVLIRKKKWDTSKIWIFLCLTAATFFKTVGTLPLIFNIQNQPFVSHSLVLFLNCGMLLFIIIYVFHHPNLLYGYLFVAANWKIETVESKNTILEPTTSPLINLLPEQLVSYTSTMKNYMEVEKPFLEHGFQISHLAFKLDIPVHHCSFVINSVIGKNFRDWINSYRIQEFILTHPLLADKMTIQAIASKTGFKTLSTFYNAFKKETGMMPTAYFAKVEQEALNAERIQPSERNTEVGGDQAKR